MGGGNEEGGGVLRSIIKRYGREKRLGYTGVEHGV
jgi:hypothetical protein